MSASLREALNLALAHHRAGRLREAEQGYRDVLKIVPHHADAWHLLGLIAHQSGQHETAIEYIGRAIATHGTSADYHNNLGEALRASGRAEEALESYERAIELRPTYAEAYYNRALTFSAAGRAAEAIASNQRATQFKPDYAAAWSNLGSLYRDQNRWDDALAAFREAIRIRPDYAIAHNNLGAALQESGRFVEAEAAYRCAVESLPDFAPGWYNLGSTLQLQERYGEALAAFERAVQLQPGYAEALCNLGALYQRFKRYDEAVASQRAALTARPDYPEAHYNLGHVLLEMDRFHEAAASFQEAVRHRPDYADAWCNLGLAERRAGRLAAAVESLQRAIACRPESADAHGSLGVVLQEQHQLTAAAAAFQQALRLRPDYAAAHNNLGNLLKEVGRLDEAAACYRQALRLIPELVEGNANGGDRADAAYRHSLRLEPRFAETQNNLGNALMDQGRLAEAVDCYREALRLKPDFAEAHSNMLFCLTHNPAVPPAEIFVEHCRWGDTHAVPPRQIPPHENDRNLERPLRIGYVSADLRVHAMARFLEPIFSQYDRSQFAVYCYSQAHLPDAMSRWFESQSQGWRPIYGVPDERVAEMIRDDRIDILVDLSGHTAGTRLTVFAHRPAPVQATYLCYPATTGLAAIDYRITDAVLDPPGEEIYSRERLVRLPRGLMCFAPRKDTPEVSPLPALRNGRITFGSMHRLSKLNPGVFDLWSRVLHAVPESRLLMYRDTLNGSVLARISQEFTSRGIDASRLDLRCETDQRGYLGVFDEIDISLDTCPYTGVTISSESLWMGVPFVTLYGDRPAARSGASLLRTVGLPELIAQTPEEYVCLTSELASDIDRLVDLRASLRDCMRTTLADHAGFTRTLEAAYREMWRAWSS